MREVRARVVVEKSREDFVKVISSPREILEKLATAYRLDLSKVDEYAFKREKNPQRADAIVRNAEYEKPKALLLLLLLYFWGNIARVKRILGYSGHSPRLSREFFRKLLWKYCDEFFYREGGRNYCIFCGEDIELDAADEHFARYEHLLSHHFRKLLTQEERGESKGGDESRSGGGEVS